jgi:hypothetical protein
MQLSHLSHGLAEGAFLPTESHGFETALTRLLIMRITK